MNHLMAEMSAVRALIDSVPGGDGLIVFGEKTPAPETLRRLQGEIQKMADDGHRVSMIAVHLASRSGTAFRPDAVMCSQSTVKAIYVGALLERFPEALAEQRERIRETIVLSSNEAYESLRDLYGPEVIRTWCRETGVEEGFADAPYPRAYSARDLLKLWTRLYCFLNGGSEAAAGVGGYFENSALSAARERLGGRCRVHTKAGWENGVGDDVTDFAHAVYDAFVEDLIANGTLHACIFGTIHPEATGYLLEKLEEKGLSAYVGKVNMDKASPEYLCETTEDSLRRTEEFLEKYAHSRTARPILTPRFAPTCSQKLLDGLGILGRKYQTGVQTHIVESRWEAAQALLDFPDASCDMEIYEKAGLLENGPVVMAHFLYPSEEDIRILKKYHGFAVQCPDSTANIIAGIMRNSYLADLGVNLSLGSDI